MLTVEAIAKVCHEANRAFCAGLGDMTQADWEGAPGWQRESAMNGVTGILDGSVRTPECSHNNWTKEKLETGWVFGRVKDPVKRTHPCLVPFYSLPDDQRQKDVLFYMIVKALEPLVE